MRIPQSRFAEPNYTKYNMIRLKIPGTQTSHSDTSITVFNVQPSETFTKVPRFGGMKPFIDHKGNQHSYLPEGIDENQLPDANVAFKQGSEKYNAYSNAFSTAAFIGDTRMVAIFLLKNYDPKLRKYTPDIYTDCKPSSRYQESSLDNPNYTETRWWADGLKGKTVCELAEIGRHPEIVQMIKALEDKTMSEWAASTEDQDKYRELKQMLNACAYPPQETNKGHKEHRVMQLLRKIPHPHRHH